MSSSNNVVNNCCFHPNSDDQGHIKLGFQKWMVIIIHLWMLFSHSGPLEGNLISFKGEWYVILWPGQVHTSNKRDRAGAIHRLIHTEAPWVSYNLSKFNCGICFNKDRSCYILYSVHILMLWAPANPTPTHITQVSCSYIIMHLVVSSVGFTQLDPDHYLACAWLSAENR